MNGTRVLDFENGFPQERSNEEILFYLWYVSVIYLYRSTFNCKLTNRSNMYKIFSKNYYEMLPTKDFRLKAL